MTLQVGKLYVNSQTVHRRDSSIWPRCKTPKRPNDVVAHVFRELRQLFEYLRTKNPLRSEDHKQLLVSDSFVVLNASSMERNAMPSVNVYKLLINGVYMGWCVLPNDSSWVVR